MFKLNLFLIAIVVVLLIGIYFFTLKILSTTFVNKTIKRFPSYSIPSKWGIIGVILTSLGLILSVIFYFFPFHTSSSPIPREEIIEGNLFYENDNGISNATITLPQFDVQSRKSNASGYFSFDKVNWEKLSLFSQVRFKIQLESVIDTIVILPIDALTEGNYFEIKLPSIKVNPTKRKVKKKTRVTRPIVNTSPKYYLTIAVPEKFSKARVYINEVWKSNAPTSFKLEKGNYLLRVEKDNFYYEEPFEIIDTAKYFAIFEKDFQTKKLEL